MKRGLVSIRAISAILPHPNADLLEIAIVDGWRVVVKKGMFIEDDFAVFFSIGSVLPMEPSYEFLRKKCYEPNLGHVLRTVVVRGELSQGLLMPFTPTLEAALERRDIGWDADLSKFFGVTGYNAPDYLLLQDIPKALLPTAHAEAVQKYCGYAVEIATRSYYKNWYHKLLNIKTVELASVKFQGDSDDYCADLMYQTLELANYLGKDVVVTGTVCGPKIAGNYHGVLENISIISNITVEGKQLSTSRRRDLVHTLQANFGFTGRHALVQVPTGKVMPLSNIGLMLQLATYTLPNGKENVGLEWRTCDGSLSFVTFSNKYLLEEK